MVVRWLPPCFCFLGEEFPGAKYGGQQAGNSTAVHFTLREQHNRHKMPPWVSKEKINRKRYFIDLNRLCLRFYNWAAV